MPRTPRLNSGLALPTDEDPLFLPEAQIYTVEERGALRAFLASPLFRKALSNARLHKPAPFIDAMNGPLALQNAALRLAQIQGWTLFEAALHKEVAVPQERRKQAVDSFPDAGRIDPPIGAPLPAPATTSTPALQAIAQKKLRTPRKK